MAKGLSIWNLIAAALGGPKTQIWNNSGKHIYLIPIACLDGYDPRKSGEVMVDEELAKVIQPGASIQVDSRKYDNNDKNSSSQIYILFRVGGQNDVKNFLKDLQNENPQGVRVQRGERLFLHFDLLACRQLFLKCNEAKQVIEDVNNAGQVDAAETQHQSELVNQINQMQGKQEELENEVKALQDEMKTLKEDFAKLSGQKRK